MTTVYHATLYDQPGYIARIDRALTFLDRATNDVIELEPTMLGFCSTSFELPGAFAPAVIARMRGCHDSQHGAMGS
jgi:hypothetical protein